MKNGIILKDLFPFAIWFSSMIIGAILIDVLLHLFNMVYIGKYLGYFGTATILFSFMYSLKKRRKIDFSSPKVLLDYHEYLALSGSILILVHAGIHVNAILPWLAILMLLINVSSGLVGKHILAQANKTMRERKLNLKHSGMNEEEIAKAIFWDTTAMDSMKKWREVHLPITYFLGFLSLVHIVSVIFFN
jgi:hypothetical protein